MLTGGFDNEKPQGSSVEVVRGDGTTCILPKMKSRRTHHTQSGLTVCGGNQESAKKSCVTFKNGKWTTSHNLKEERDESDVSWKSPNGILLLGGKTAELLSSTSSSTTEQFTLPYNT